MRPRPRPERVRTRPRPKNFFEAKTEATIYEAEAEARQVSKQLSVYEHED